MSDVKAKIQVKEFLVERITARAVAVRRCLREDCAYSESTGERQSAQQGLE